MNKVKRKDAAIFYLNTLSCSEKVIINIDETIIENSDDRKYSWVARNESNLVQCNSDRMSKVSIIFACSNMGEILFTA